MTARTRTKSPTRYKSDIYNVVSQKKRSSLLPASHSSLPQRGFVRNHFYDRGNLYRKVIHGIFLQCIGGLVQQGDNLVHFDLSVTLNLGSLESATLSTIRPIQGDYL